MPARCTRRLIAEAFAPGEVASWGWRLPFFAGLFVGLAGLYVRRHIPELPHPKADSFAGSPVWKALRTHWRTILRIGLLNVINGVGFYVAFVFLVTYMQTIGELREARDSEASVRQPGRGRSSAQARQAPRRHPERAIFSTRLHP